MLYIVTILVCAAGNPHCSRGDAAFITEVPEPAPSLSLCALAGQAYIAQTALMQDTDTVRIVCTPGGTPGGKGP